MDEKDKREKYIKFLFELTELPEAFTGLQVFLIGFFKFLTSFIFQSMMSNYIATHVKEGCLII